MSPMAQVLVDIAFGQVDSPDGVNTSKLLAPARNHLTAGPLYKKYEQVRANALFVKEKAAVETPGTVRLQGIDTLLLNPSMTPDQVAELNAIKTILDPVLSSPDKVVYMMANLDVRGKIVSEWVPNHPMVFFKYLVSGGRFLNCSMYFSGVWVLCVCMKFVLGFRVMRLGYW